jgi:hypothetical protein
MPITTLSLTRASIVWRPGHVTRLAGHAVLSVVAYDGVKGFQPPQPLPPIRFKRRARRGYDLIAPSAAGVGDDGLLIATFADAPKALGWMVNLTLTDTQDQANQVIDGATQVVTAGLGLVPGFGGVAQVFEGIAKVVKGIFGAHIAGTWIGSESDADDLSHDWRIWYEQLKAGFELEYDVKTGEENDDD